MTRQLARLGPFCILSGKSRPNAHLWEPIFRFGLSLDVHMQADITTYLPNEVSSEMKNKSGSIYRGRRENVENMCVVLLVKKSPDQFRSIQFLWLKLKLKELPGMQSAILFLIKLKQNSVYYTKLKWNFLWKINKYKFNIFVNFIM